MFSDSLSSVSKNNNTIISMGSSNPKDFSKKKRGNRSAKLKQCKLDARREQWLSQVKQKGVKEKPDVGSSIEVSTKSANHTRGRTIEKLEIRPREKEKAKEEIDGGSMHYSDSESSSNSPTSNISGGSDSGTAFTENSISRSNSSSCSGGFFSRSVSEDDDEEEEEEVDDDDDGGWEAIADALAASERKQEEHKNNNGALKECRPEVRSHPVSVSNTSQSKPPRRGSVNCRAWRPDDNFRPQSLPELSKQQYRFHPERCRVGGAVWGYKNVSFAAPSPCPICCEDLDFTDSSFLPCPCGFKLCLFCYKRILEEDGRCPGCRKQYDHRLLGCSEPAFDGGSLISRFGRSCSLV